MNLVARYFIFSGILFSQVRSSSSSDVSYSLEAPVPKDQTVQTTIQEKCEKNDQSSSFPNKRLMFVFFRRFFHLMRIVFFKIMSR